MFLDHSTTRVPAPWDIGGAAGTKCHETSLLWWCLMDVFHGQLPKKPESNKVRYNDHFFNYPEFAPTSVTWRKCLHGGIGFFWVDMFYSFEVACPKGHWLTSDSSGAFATTAAITTAVSAATACCYYYYYYYYYCCCYCCLYYYYDHHHNSHGWE